ncbi:MAG: sensor histidine kinase [Gemmatimonadaceae bacterium]
MQDRRMARTRDRDRADRARLLSIVERLADGVVIQNERGTILFANPAAEELFGRPLHQLTGVELGMPAILGDTSEIEVVRPGGAVVTAELRVVETEFDGEMARLVSIRDITDRRRAAERAVQLERERLARAEAEATSHAKSDFLATMSHELRTPLNAILGYAELLDLGVSGPMTQDQKQQVTRIRSSGRHLLGLVNEVLDLAKVEAGRLSVQNQASRADQVIDAAVALVQPMAEARGLALGSECLDGALFDGDEERVRQILVNLLNNAVKFTPPAGRVTLTCGLERAPAREARLTGAGPWVCMTVSDTGIGIPADRLAAIFDPFVQVEGGHTRRSDGTGLGLTISRRLARLMGGDLTVSSEMNKGSTFTLWLREASVAQQEDARWRTESPDAAARLHGLSDAGAALLHDLGALVDAFVSRMRDESVAPGVESLRASQIADHMACYVADVAVLLSAIEESRGHPSSFVADAGDIQHYIAERHGAQRSRLGWSAAALHKEWQILRDEIERVLQRASKGLPRNALPEALLIVDRLLEQARDRSVRALERASA